MVFSLRLLQEKCNEQNKFLYIAFIHLTKVFDLVCKEEIFAILLKIECPLNLFIKLSLFIQTQRQQSNMIVLILIHLKLKVG